MRARRTAVVIGAVVTVAALAGCSTGPGVVAQVEGTTITEGDLDRVIDELGPMLANPSRDAVLTALVQAEAGLALAEPNGIEVPDAEAAEELLTSTANGLEVPVSDWGEGSLAIARLQLIGRELANTVGVEQATTLFQEAFAAADVTVSPRYGEYDPTAGAVVALHPAWIVDPAAAEPTAE